MVYDYKNEIGKYERADLNSAFKYIHDNLPDKLHLCNNCKSVCLVSTTQEYTFQCMWCDTDLCEFETHNGNIDSVSDEQIHRVVLGVLQTWMFSEVKRNDTNDR